MIKSYHAGTRTYKDYNTVTVHALFLIHNPGSFTMLQVV